MSEDQGIPLGASVDTVEAYLGGGGSSSLLRLTITAAQIAAAWDEAGDAAVEIPEIVSPTWLLLPLETANDLDQNVTLGGFYGYTSGATTGDVTENGDQTGALEASGSSFGTHAGYVQYTASSDQVKIAVLLEDSAAYLLYNGDAAPTTGSSTVLIPLG